MRYTPEITAKLVEDYKTGKSVTTLSVELTEIETQRLGVYTLVPERSIIAKLSNLGVYKKKEYLTKRGEVPIKKEEYIERIGRLLDIDLDLLESLEKVTKTALTLMEKRIAQLKELD
jgi:hypothetical protein